MGNPIALTMYPLGDTIGGRPLYAPLMATPAAPPKLVHYRLHLPFRALGLIARSQFHSGVALGRTSTDVVIGAWSGVGGAAVLRVLWVAGYLMKDLVGMFSVDWFDASWATVMRAYSVVGYLMKILLDMSSVGMRPFPTTSSTNGVFLGLVAPGSGGCRPPVKSGGVNDVCGADVMAVMMGASLRIWVWPVDGDGPFVARATAGCWRERMASRSPHRSWRPRW